MALLLVVREGQAQPGRIIWTGSDGRLQYEADALGNRVPDFSHCGYAGADRPIPAAPVRVVVEPTPGDSTERIQQAIDYVATLPPDTTGLRGAVLLLRGRHTVHGGLRIDISGVVLRGQGMGPDGTELFAAGQDRRTLIRIVGRKDLAVRTNADWKIIDAYVPVGATSFHVQNADLIKLGDPVQVVRPSTQEWIQALGALDFGGGVGGRWKPGQHNLVWDRVVKAVVGHRIILDAPITTAIEARFGGGFVARYEWPGRILNVGVESIRLVSDFDRTNPKDENHAWCAITMENTADAWVRQVAIQHFAGSAVAIYESCKRVTVQDCLSLDPVSEEGGYRRHTFFTMGQQTLFLRCYAEHGRHDFAAGHCAAGPNAFVQCEAHLPLRDSGPIESWASGTLYDNVTIDGNALALGYRAGSGASIGWAAANSVLWQCSAAVIRCYNPPTARNWAFGCWAQFDGEGIWRHSNEFVSPDSLYAGQLHDRLGSQAAAQLQLMPRPRQESSNPRLERAQELAAKAHQPAPQLRDYIAAAGTREPIPCDPRGAVNFDARDNRKRESSPQSRSSGLKSQLGTEREKSLLTSAATKPLVITNGWLTVDGRLLIGGTSEVMWWRGSIRPSEVHTFGPGVTRFVPGRIGPGYTDDLNELADSLLADGKAALDHHYGLWYDRRRDDHQRVRRMDGDVLPPFYEQPFARSGQGTAWDGLSQYDLTRFNPWYWKRLREFATLCEQRGLVLLHQHYFQHNILEAGAHYADFPWRTANNINGTGFPEPPNYAGGKRIFMAELFYDVNHPVRRRLHRRYIRQCLDNFTNNANVIQLTSAEFTGPLHFMQFWLDVIAEWQHERAESGKPLVGLSCTKDVQDAVLANPQRRTIVDVIDFRYWWRTAQGEFAPPGGKNLALRQFERRSRVGRPGDEDLAGMAAEYRARHPDKAIICNFDSARWAWVCAGGSQPRLPRTSDPDLLRAIPRMKPWPEASRDGRWVLRERGRQYLAYGGAGTALDLSEELGTYQVNEVDTRTGMVTHRGMVEAGTKVTLLNATVVWLVRR